jgi:thiol-disulfide isomerase/thioredoxin
MIRFVLIFVFVSLFSFSKAATISGTVSPVRAEKLFTLIVMNYDTRVDSIVQQVYVKPDGSFSFQLDIKEPALYRLGFVEELALVYILLKPDDNIILKIDKDQVVCSGSPDTQFLIDYEIQRKNLHKTWVQPVLDSMDASYAKGDKSKVTYWNNQHDSVINRYKEDLGKWVVQSSFIYSLAAIHHSLRWHSDNDVALMDTMLANYQKKYPGYQLTQQLENKVIRTKRIALGSIAPSFTSMKADNSSFDFKNIKGKYILLDFWASWCGPCRKESPMLVKAYGLYQEKGFTIVSVSLDDNEAKWIKAIKKDQYTWTNVSDLKGWSSSAALIYSVSSIPSNFLLDSEGRIIAKNLTGTELEKKLEELFLKK